MTDHATPLNSPGPSAALGCASTRRHRNRRQVQVQCICIMKRIEPSTAPCGRDARGIAAIAADCWDLDILFVSTGETRPEPLTTLRSEVLNLNGIETCCHERCCVLVGPTWMKILIVIKNSSIQSIENAHLQSVAAGFVNYVCDVADH